MREWATEPPERAPDAVLLDYYSALSQRLGPQHWWPARTRLEIVLGAILTQNTAWKNARLALRRMRQAGLLTLEGLLRATRQQLETAIRPAGFYRQKARTVQNFVARLKGFSGGSLEHMFAQPAEELRKELLDVSGLGPETVDAILLYAGRRPFFVADAYTRRILARHGLIPARAGYAETQDFLHQRLPRETKMFNEFHALLVEVGKRYCKRSEPHCQGCPLEEWLPAGTAERSRRANLSETLVEIR